MQTASALARPAYARRAVDLVTEMAYWRQAHANGHLGHHDFSDYASLLKMGYDVYLAYPRATEAQLYRVLQESYHPHGAVGAMGRSAHGWFAMPGSIWSNPAAATDAGRGSPWTWYRAADCSAIRPDRAHLPLHRTSASPWRHGLGRAFHGLDLAMELLGALAGRRRRIARRVLEALLAPLDHVLGKRYAAPDHHLGEPVDQVAGVFELVLLAGQRMVDVLDHPRGQRPRIGERRSVVLEHLAWHDQVLLGLERWPRPPRAAPVRAGRQ